MILPGLVLTMFTWDSVNFQCVLDIMDFFIWGYLEKFVMGLEIIEQKSYRILWPLGDSKTAGGGGG